MEKVPFDDPSEYLYIRVGDEDVEGGEVLPPAVKLPDWSANRQKFSKPEDVLVGYDDYTKIAEFTVGSIPPRIEPEVPKDGGPRPATWLFWAEHDPVDNNDAHSEVRMRKDGSQYRRGKFPSSTTYKTYIRRRLARILRVRS